MTKKDFIDLAKNMVVAYFNTHIKQWDGSIPPKQRTIDVFDVNVLEIGDCKGGVRSIELEVVDDYSVSYFVEYDPTHKEPIHSYINRRKL